jgi:peptide/nickel transport system substrate-binding protein
MDLATLMIALVASPPAHCHPHMRSSILVVAAAILITACSSKEGSQSGGPSGDATGGTMIYAAPSEPLDLFPPFVGDLVGRIVQDLVYERLAEIGPDMVTVGDKGFTPLLAKSWAWAPDSLSIAFALDPHARWHDEKPVTANDVRYSFKVFTDPKVGSSTAPLLSNIDSVSARDSLTPVVWFKKRTPEQFYDIAYQLLIMPEHVFGSIPAEQLHTSEITRRPVGTGRFRFAKWDPGVRFELIADTMNYHGRAKLDRLIITPADPAAGATQVLSGQADFMDTFPFDQAPKLDSNAFARPIFQVQGTYAFLAMNKYAPKSSTTANAIFSDSRVRRALSMSVDRAGMLQNVFHGKGRIGHGPFPTVAWYGDSTLRVPPYDTVAAKALLDSAGWRVGPNGIRTKNGRALRFTMLVPTSSAQRTRYSVLLQDQFRKVGAQADLDRLDPGAMRDRVQSYDYDAVITAYHPDPSPSGARQYWSTAGIGATGQNTLRYSNRAVDALLDSVSSALDPATMKTYASRAFQKIIDDAPAIWLYDFVVVSGINRRITLPPLRTDEWWANLADWTIPPDKRIERDRIGLTPRKR